MTGMGGKVDGFDEAASEVLETLALAFAPCGSDEWEELTGRESWDAVLESCGTVASSRGETLAGLLNAGEIGMLESPLGYAEKTAFEAGHFTGGLPESVVPVESLYRRPKVPGSGPCYEGPSAEYMRALVRRMGLQIPDALAAYPDHLAVEADLAALLVRSGSEDAPAFIAVRLDWLVAYRSRLVRLADAERCFYCALVDVALSVVDAAMQVDAKDQKRIDI